MKNRILEIVKKRKDGINAGISSFCSANKIIIEAILQETKQIDEYALIEATSNQVNQFGGYMNMQSKDFKEYVYKIADKLDFDKSKIINNELEFDIYEILKDYISEIIRDYKRGSKSKFY